MIKKGFFLGLLLHLFFNGFAHKSENRNIGAWELISVSDGVEMFERWIQIAAETKVRERTGKMIVNGTAKEALALVCDNTRAAEWMPNVEKVTVLKRKSNEDFFIHTILNTPWPFNKQDMVSEYKVSYDKQGNIRVVITPEKCLLPKQKDVDRLDTFSAEWLIKPIGNHKVQITFTTKSTRPPEYPSWVQDPVVRRVFINNLKNFKALINQA